MIDLLVGHPNLNKKEALSDEEDINFSWQLLEQIVRENRKKNDYSNQITVSLATILLSLITRNLNDKEAFSPLKSGGKNSKYIDSIKMYIKTNLHDTAKLRLNVIANHFNTTKSTLSIKFKRDTGQSLHNYIITQRLDSAMDKLINTDFTVSQIAFQLGFTDESHLTRMFKKYENCTPKAYRLKYTQEH
ncbi:MAG: helix-turn-helix transcriptional regulator [Leeuwenhoekiella sp.]